MIIKDELDKITIDDLNNLHDDAINTVNDCLYHYGHQRIDDGTLDAIRDDLYAYEPDCIDNGNVVVTASPYVTIVDGQCKATIYYDVCKYTEDDEIDNDPILEFDDSDDFGLIAKKIDKINHKNSEYVQEK